MSPPEKDKPRSSVPPKSLEELEAHAAYEAACEDVKAEAQKLHASAKSLKRTISGSRMHAVRLPTPSELEIEAPPPKP